MATWYVSYSQPMAPPGGLAVRVSPEAGCMLQLTSALVGVALPDRAELGEYRGALPDEEAEALHKLATEAIAAVLGDVEPLEPGTAVLELELGKLGSPAEQRASVVPSDSLPAAVVRYRDAMLKVAGALFEHPYAVVRGKATCAPPIPGHLIDVTLELGSAGSVPASISNPLAAQGELPMRLMIRKDVPEDRLEPEDTVFLALAAGEATLVRPVGAAPAKGGPIPALRLGPGETVSFRLQPRRSLFLAPGAYRVSVSIDLAPLQLAASEDVVHGTLRVPAGVIQVAKNK